MLKGNYAFIKQGVNQWQKEAQLKIVEEGTLKRVCQRVILNMQ